MIVRGDKQKKEEYADLSTQTVNTESIFLMLAIAGFEKRVLGVFDVTGAYLKANMQTPDDRGLFCKINSALADVFVESSQTTKRCEIRMGHFLSELIEPCMAAYNHHTYCK